MIDLIEQHRDALDNALVWGIVQSRLPRLLAQAEALLHDAGEGTCSG